MYEPFTDPVLELVRRCGGDAGDVFELASQISDDDARDQLRLLDEAEAEETAAGLKEHMRRGGLLS
jgi:hypothetical protein